MRTVATNVYNYFELSNQAKEKAFDDFCYSHDFPYHYDNEKTLDKLQSYTDTKLTGWEYDMYSFRFNVEVNYDELDELSGVELRDYLIDNFYDYMMDKKEISGYFLDWVFLKEMKQQLVEIDLNGNTEITYHHVMYKCFKAVFEAICDDLQNYYSIGNFEELNEMNEWEYLENGELY